MLYRRIIAVCSQIRTEQYMQSLLFVFILAIRKNTVYKLMWWSYKARYVAVYYYDVAGHSSSDVTSGAL